MKKEEIAACDFWLLQRLFVIRQFGILKMLVTLLGIKYCDVVHSIEDILVSGYVRHDTKMVQWLITTLEVPIEVVSCAALVADDRRTTEKNEAAWDEWVVRQRTQQDTIETFIVY